MKVNIICYLVIFLIVTNSILAQESIIHVSTSSVTQVPADAIYFSITISVQDGDPQKAFEDHKILEKNLLKIIKEFEIPDSNISYSLLQIRNQMLKDVPKFHTSQIVSMKVQDFNKYEPIQLALLSNGIYNYNAKFTTEGKDEWVEKAVQEALAKAMKEAELTAKNLNKDLGEILKIESSQYYPSTSEGIMASTIQSPGESLIDIPHFVQMRVSLRVEFELLDKED